MLPPAIRPLIDQLISTCDGIAADLAEVERELAEVQGELSQQVGEYEHFWEQLPIACVAADEKGRILSANPAAAAVLNVSVRSLPDRALILFVEDREDFQKLLAAARTQAGGVRTTLNVRPRERAPLEADVHVICRSAGDPRVCYVFIDPLHALAGAGRRVMRARAGLRVGPAPSRL
jgi:PAS domain-containing protein